MIVKKIYNYIYLKVLQLINIVNMKYEKIKYGKNCCFKGKIYVSGNITIKNRVKINSGRKYNIIGGDTRTILRTIDNGSIYIDEGCGISNSTLISQKSIILEKNVFLGGGVKIYDTDFHPLELKERIESKEKGKSLPVIIHEGAFIGAHSIILKGVSIGKNSIIGAGSVVTRDIPDNQIWAGNPVKFIRNI